MPYHSKGALEAAVTVKGAVRCRARSLSDPELFHAKYGEAFRVDAAGGDEDEGTKLRCYTPHARRFVLTAAGQGCQRPGFD